MAAGLIDDADDNRHSHIQRLTFTLSGRIGTQASRRGVSMNARNSLAACFMLCSLTPLLPPLAAPARAQTANDAQAVSEAERETTRERVRTLLATAGAKSYINIAFHQSDKNPWNFAGIAKGGFANSDFLEVVVSVGDKNTLAVQVYPHYHGAYINVGRAKDPGGLMHKLLNLNEHNFFFWGADDSGDVFAAYPFTLESGFPDQSLLVALTSIRTQDHFISDLRPYIDAAAK